MRSVWLLLLMAVVLTLSPPPVFALTRDTSTSADGSACLEQTGAASNHARVVLPDMRSNFTNEASLVMWVKMRNSPPPTDTGKGGLCDFGTAQYGTHYPWNATDSYIGELITARPGVGALSGVVDKTEWHQLAITIDSSGNYNIYQNGTSSYAGTGQSFGLLAEPLLGGDSEPSIHLNGWMDDVQLYNTALSGTDISELYAAPGTAKTGLVGRWNFEDAGNPWADSSGNGYDGVYNPYAENLSPADGAQNQGYEWVLLDWDADVMPASYDVYFGTDPNNWDAPTSTTETALEVDVDPNTVYYWAVDAKDAGGSVLVAGETLSFSTGTMIAHWKLDETSGTVAADSSGNGYAVDVSALDPNGLAWTDGVIRGALQMKTDYISVGSTLALGNVDQVSVSVWANRSSGSAGQYLFDIGGGQHVMLCYVKNNHFEFAFNDGGSTYYWGSSSYVMPADQWNHVVVTYDRNSSTRLRLYMNGSYMAATNTTTTAKTLENFNWGARVGGPMDDMRLYHAVLSPSEVADLYAEDARAWNPDPADTEDRVLLDKVCAWDPGYDLTGQTFQISTVSDFSTLVDSATLAAGASSYDPLGATDLTLETPYYWRILSEQDSGAWIATGPTWTFTTIGPVATDPDPADTATGVAQNKILGWLAGANYDSGAGDHHEVYLAAGTGEGDLPIVPTTTVTGEAYDPSGVNELAFNTAYVWRVDEYIGGTTYTGDVWTFTTGDAICDPVLLADTNGDCVVNLTDFAQLAAEWLDCTLTNGDCP